MKKTLLFAWIFLSGMCFIACSSDDDNNNKSPVEERVHDLDIFTDRLITVDDEGKLEGVNTASLIETASPVSTSMNTIVRSFITGN